MDANLFILALSVVVIVAYGFDVIGRKIRLPSVVLLLATGIALRIARRRARPRTAMMDVLVPAFEVTFRQH